MPVSRQIYVRNFAGLCSWPTGVQVLSNGSRAEVFRILGPCTEVSIQAESEDRFVRLTANAIREGADYRVTAQYNLRPCPLVMTGPVYDAGDLIYSRSYHLIKIIEQFPAHSEQDALPSLFKIVSAVKSSRFGIQVDVGKLLAARGQPVRAENIGAFKGAVDCILSEVDDLVLLQGTGLNQLLEMGGGEIQQATLRLSRGAPLVEGVRDVAVGAATAARAGGVVFSGMPEKMIWDLRVFAPLAIGLLIPVTAFLIWEQWGAHASA